MNPHLNNHIGFDIIKKDLNYRINTTAKRGMMK